MRRADRTKLRGTIEQKLRLWQKNQMALLAKEGYQKMAHEDVLDAEAYLSATSEILED